MSGFLLSGLFAAVPFILLPGGSMSKCQDSDVPQPAATAGIGDIPAACSLRRPPCHSLPASLAFGTLLCVCVCVPVHPVPYALNHLA